MKDFDQTPEGYLHYLACGLPNIYLVDGFKIRETKRGRTVRINDLRGLNRAIAMDIVENEKTISPQQFKFLRKNMLMSQKALASSMQSEEQNVSNWERGILKEGIPGTAQLAIRAVYLAHTKSNAFAQAIKDIAELEHNLGVTDRVFSDQAGRWELEAA